VPAATPVTTPDVEPTVAVPGALLVQVPPDIEWLSVTVPAGQTLFVPVIDGNAVTVTGTVLEQPVDVNVNVIVDVPAVTPVTTPLDAPTVATPVEPLTHVPVPDASVSVIEVHAVTGVLPDGVAGNAETVIVLNAEVPQGAA